MIRRGYTLAEVLVTLGIIGVVAAVIVPAISHLKPDKNKAGFLQAYDTISETVKSLAANTSIYPVCKDMNNANNVNCSQNPLFNTNLPRDERFNNARYSGERKLCSLMGWSLGVSDDDLDCSNNTYAFNAANYTNGFANPSFTTKNGMRWRIVPAVASTAANGVGTYQTDIYVDVDPKNNDVNGTDESCIYAADTCEQPDIFKFMVAANGRVSAADPIGKAYLAGRKNWIRKDVEINNNVIAAASPDRTFEYIPCRGLTEEEQCIQDGGFWYDNACHDTPQGGGDDDLACLENLSQEGRQNVHTIVDRIWAGESLCNRSINSIAQPTISDHQFTARFGYPVASPVTVTFPTFEYVNGNHAKPEYGEASCTVPIGETSCSGYSQYANSVPASTIELSLEYDAKYFYLQSGNELLFFRHFSP